MADPKSSRGYKNMNPGNLNYIADPARAWNGQIGLGDEWLTGDQRRFGRYKTHAYGIRALIGQLTVNQTRRGLNTIAKQISSWAPATDSNDTQAYIDAVSAKTGIAKNAIIDVKQYSVARALVEEIIRMECGGMPYTSAEIDEGLALYGVTPHSEKVVNTIAEAASTGTGRGAGGVGAAVMAAVPAAPLVQSFAGLPQWTAVALIGAVALIAVVVILINRKDA